MFCRERKKKIRASHVMPDSLAASSRLMLSRRPISTQPQPDTTHTCRTLLIQHPPIPLLANPKLILILLSLLNLDLFVELVIAGLVGGMMHLLWLPCWVGERTSEENRWLDSLFEELDRHGDCLGCHYGCVLERKAADFEAW